MLSYWLLASAMGFSAEEATDPDVSLMMIPYSCAARVMVRATGDSFIAERSRLAGSRSIWPIASCVPPL